MRRWITMTIVMRNRVPIVEAIVETVGQGAPTAEEQDPGCRGSDVMR